MARQRKTTAHRPSQADQEFVINSHGEKVRNTAYDPKAKKTKGKKSKNDASGDFGSADKVAQVVLKSASVETPASREYAEDRVDDLAEVSTAVSDQRELTGDDMEKVKGFLAPINEVYAWNGRGIPSWAENAPDIPYNSDMVLKGYEHEGMKIEPYIPDNMEKDVYSPWGINGAFIHSEDKDCPTFVGYEEESTALVSDPESGKGHRIDTTDRVNIYFDRKDTYDMCEQFTDAHTGDVYSRFSTQATNGKITFVKRKNGKDYNW